MSKSNERMIVLDILNDITKSRHYADRLLRGALGANAELTRQQRAFVTETVKGVIRNMILLDYIIGCCSSVPVKKMKPAILNILRLTVYQLRFMNGVPDFAACSEGVELARRKGFAGLTAFVNAVAKAVIRNSPQPPTQADDPVGHLSILYSYPRWIIELWLKRYGYETVHRLCEACGTSPDVTVTVNTLKTTRSGLKAALEREGMLSSEGAICPDSLHISRTDDMTASAPYRNGLFHVMDESSALAVRVLDPRPGDTVVDVCAAPGGKSLYAAQLMQNTGAMYSRDADGRKLKLITSGAERLGVGNLHVRQADARVIDPELVGKADRVLVDAPCSGLGLVRKKPDIKYLKSTDDIHALARLQREILSASAEYVKPGGVLVYCTCTVTEEENDANAEWFIKNNPFRTDAIERRLPGEHGGMICGPGTVQLLPGERNDGFYIARMIRID